MLSWLEILLRVVSLFILLLITARLIGKRSLSRSSPFYFMSYNIITVIVALTSVKVIQNYAFGLLALGTWLVLLIGIENLASKSKWVYDLTKGKETILIKHGKILDENLSQVRITPEDLLRELRFKNAFNLPDVEFAIMESNGDINVFFKSDKKPVTAHDLEIKTAPQTEPQIVILDGNILDESLSSLGLNQAWLKTQLKNAGINIENIFVGQVDSSGDMYFDLFDDTIQTPQPKVKEMLHANLEKAYSDLMSYALETNSYEAKKMYSTNANKLKQALDKVKPYLLN